MFTVNLYLEKDREAPPCVVFSFAKPGLYRVFLGGQNYTNDSGHGILRFSFIETTINNLCTKPKQTTFKL